MINKNKKKQIGIFNNSKLNKDEEARPKWAFVYFIKIFKQNVHVLKLSSKMSMF